MSSILKFTEAKDRDLNSNVMRIHEKGDPNFGRLKNYVNKSTKIPSDAPFDVFVYGSLIMQ